VNEGVAEVKSKL